MNSNANAIIAGAAGALVGAGIMYILDPDGGRRRRAVVRDKLVRSRTVLADAAETAESKAEDLRNRAQGLAHDVQSRLTEEEVDDTTLEARVRSAMGRAVSTPGAIQVTAYNGRVTLTGQILAREAEQLLSAVRGVRGVDRIDNFLEVHESPEGVSSLQGARTH